MAVQVDTAGEEGLDRRLVTDGKAQGVRQCFVQGLHEGAGGSIVELVRRLIQEEDGRAGDEGTGEADALLFAAGEDALPFCFVIKAGGEAAEADLLQRGGEAFVRDTVACGVAEDGAQGVLWQVGALRQGEDAARGQAVMPPVVRPDARQGTQQGGFADAARAVEQQAFGGGGMQVEVLPSSGRPSALSMQRFSVVLLSLSLSVAECLAAGSCSSAS